MKMPQFAIVAGSSAPINVSELSVFQSIQLGYDFQMLRRIVRRAAHIVRPSLDADLERVVQKLVQKPGSRRWLNAIYNQLSLKQKGAFHTSFAKAFRDKTAAPTTGNWSVNFLGQPVLFPLSEKESWLEWDSAISLLGHEPEIKKFYSELIQSKDRPGLVIDIGANYGLHSLLFLVHEIPTISFEPNPHCHAFFKRLCELNDVDPMLETCALSDQEGVTQLYFPLAETWLGTTDASVADTWKNKEVFPVKMKTLDNYLAEKELIPSLIKMDTEGSELKILKGAAQTLKKYRPMVVFESWPGDMREALYDFLAGAGYELYALTLDFSLKKLPIVLNKKDFERASSSNFLALSI